METYANIATLTKDAFRAINELINSLTMIENKTEYHTLIGARANYHKMVSDRLARESEKHAELSRRYKAGTKTRVQDIVEACSHPEGYKS